MTTRRIETASGAVYEIDDNRIRRLNTAHPKRGDGDWQALIEPIPERSVVGEKLRIVMASLHRYGPDDDGNLYDESTATVRVTTAVIWDSWKAWA